VCSRRQPIIAVPQCAGREPRSYRAIDDPDLIAYEIPIDRCRDLYGSTYRDIVEDLHKHDDMRVPDFDGQRNFLNESQAA
jgi:hypothetical protein